MANQQSTRLSALFLAPAAWLLLAAGAHAASISYSLTMCENLAVLKAPLNLTLAHNLAASTQHTLMMDRTMPYFELKNTAASATITQFTLTIGNTANNFDWSKLVEASPGVTFSLQSPDAVIGSLKSDQLTINFTGFDPGEFVRFRAGLSPDVAGNPIVDFRQTLFHLNNMNLPGSNATLGVVFHESDGNQTLTRSLPNFSVTPTATSLSFMGGCGNDSIVPFVVEQQGIAPSPPVPEPGGLALLALGSLALVPLLRRPRR